MRNGKNAVCGGAFDLRFWEIGVIIEFIFGFVKNFCAMIYTLFRNPILH